MDKREKVISKLQILRTWCAVNPDYDMGLSAEDCVKAVGWLDDALALLKAQENEIEELKQEIEGHKDNLRETLDEMMRYANELKAHEPKIISLRDVVCADVGNVVWLETYYDGATGIEPFLVCIDFTQKPVIINGWDSFYNISEQELNDGIVNSLDDEFTVRKFRFWSSKPTDEQREAIPWSNG